MTDKDKYRLLCGSEKSIPLFSQDWWLDTACGEAKWDVLLIEQKGRTLAALPLYIPHRGILSMPPYTQTLGPWFAPDSNDTKYATALGRKQELSKTFVEKLERYPHFLQNFNHQITDWLPFYWAGYRQTTRYTYLLNLDDMDRIWNNMSSNIRRNIQKAKEKHRISVRKGIPLADFMKVHALTFKRQNKAIPQDIRVLERLIQTCRQRGQGDLWGGYDPEGRIHAAAFIAWQGDSAWYLAGGGDPELRDSGAHSLVLWECIQAMSPRSEYFDFEGSMIPGVERFFREFGGIQTPFFTITKGKMSLLLRAWLKLKDKWR